MAMCAACNQNRKNTTYDKRIGIYICSWCYINNMHNLAEARTTKQKLAGRNYFKKSMKQGNTFLQQINIQKVISTAANTPQEKVQKAENLAELIIQNAKEQIEFLRAKQIFVNTMEENDE